MLLMPTSGVPGASHLFWCPGCECAHFIGPGWAYDGNADAPTVSPSILVRSGNVEGPTTCHLFIRGGELQFLSDCTHGLRGRTVRMVPMPGDE